MDEKQLDDEEMAFGIYKNLNPKKRLRNYLTFTIRHITFKLRGVQLHNSDVASQTIIQKTRIFIKKDLGIKFLNALHFYKQQEIF